MLGKKKNNKLLFFNEPVGTNSNIDAPMLSKQEQRSLQTNNKKKQGLSLYNTENTVAFTPDYPFSIYRTIENKKVPIFKVIPKEVKEEVKGQDSNEEVRCGYCGVKHKHENSLFIPTKMYDEGENRVFEGEGYYDCFECAYRFVLNQTGYFFYSSSFIYESAKYYLKSMFQLSYPHEELIPAPTFEHMNHDWCGKYTFVRLHGCIYRRGITFYYIDKNEVNVDENQKEEKK